MGPAHQPHKAGPAILSIALSVFPARGVFVEIFLQIGPWTLSGYNFLLETPIEVNPKPTSLYHRSLYFGIIFTML